MGVYTSDPSEWLLTKVNEVLTYWYELCRVKDKKLGRETVAKSKIYGSGYNKDDWITLEIKNPSQGLSGDSPIVPIPVFV